MEEDYWLGKAVSIECNDKMGVFQGIISQCSPYEITIIRAFRNGVPTRNQSSEVTLRCSDIHKLSLIPTNRGLNSTGTPILVKKPTPVKQSKIALKADATFVSSSKPQKQQQKQKPNFALKSDETFFSDSKQQEQQKSNLTLKPDTTFVSDSKQQQQNNFTLNPDATFVSDSKQQQQQANFTLKPHGIFVGNLQQQQRQQSNFGFKPDETFISCTKQQQQQQQFDVNSCQTSNVTNNKLNYSSNNHLENLFNFAKTSSPLPMSLMSSNKESTATNCVAKFFGNLIPPKVEVKFGPSITNAYTNNSNTVNNAEKNFYGGNGSSKSTDLVDNCGSATQNCYMKIYRNSNNYGINSNNGNNNGLTNGTGARIKQRNRQLRRENSTKHQQAFDTCVDDPLLSEDFDFEGNLALFDKQAIWNSLDAGKKPDLVQQAVSMQRQQRQQQKYRHDENIIVAEPTQMRQIESLFEGSEDFITDEGLIIPTIPLFVREKIEMCAEKCGFALQRQIDLLARGTTDLALLLLGGARRLTPKNRHQWPTVVIICETSDNFRTSNIGAAVGRQLASLGLTVLLYLEEDPTIEQKSIEVSLFKSTGNIIMYTVGALPTPDLVILSANTSNISSHIKKWLNENRASVLAIDPPASGMEDVCIKYAILPILPLNGISSDHYGKLYLCNLSIPEKFYQDAGVKYKSPFGHKFVIPIHSMH